MHFTLPVECMGPSLGSIRQATQRCKPLVTTQCAGYSAGIGTGTRLSRGRNSRSALPV